MSALQPGAGVDAIHAPDCSRDGMVQDRSAETREPSFWYTMFRLLRPFLPPSPFEGMVGMLGRRGGGIDGLTAVSAPPAH